MVIMSGVRSRIKIAKIPQSFKGTPILFVTASLLSLAFLGFKGETLIKQNALVLWTVLNAAAVPLFVLPTSRLFRE